MQRCERGFRLIAQPEARFREISPAPASAGSGPQEREDLRVLPLFAFRGGFASSLTFERGFPRQLPKNARVRAEMRPERCPRASSTAHPRIRSRQGCVRCRKRIARETARRGEHALARYLVARGGKGAETGPQGFSTAECFRRLRARPSAAHVLLFDLRVACSAIETFLCDPCTKRTAPCFMSCGCSHEAGGGCVRTGFLGRGLLSGSFLERQGSLAWLSSWRGQIRR